MKRVERTGEYTQMPSWLIEQSTRAHCEVCGCKYGTLDARFIKRKQCVDHLFPVRFLLALGLEPHLSINTLSVCGSCHAKKLVHETRIFAGDVLGFLEGLNAIGYPMERVNEAAEHYGFQLPPPRA